jgi:hypothetical protein
MVSAALLQLLFFVAILVSGSIGLFYWYYQSVRRPPAVDPEGTVVRLSIPLPAGDSGEAVLSAREAKRAEDAILSQPSWAKAKAQFLAEGSRGASNAADPSAVQAARAEKRAIDRRMLVVPGVAYLRQLEAHARLKETELEVLWTEVEKRFLSVWARDDVPRRQALLESVKREVRLAVSPYVGEDDALFDALCPELSVDVLKRSRNAPLPRLAALAAAGRLRRPKRSAAFDAVAAALREGADAAGLGGRERTFVSLLRRLCICCTLLAVVQRSCDRNPAQSMAAAKRAVERRVSGNKGDQDDGAHWSTKETAFTRMLDSGFRMAMIYAGIRCLTTVLSLARGAA